MWGALGLSQTRASCLPDLPLGEFLPALASAPFVWQGPLSWAPGLCTLHAHLHGVSTCWVCRRLKMKLLISPVLVPPKTPPLSKGCHHLPSFLFLLFHMDASARSTSPALTVRPSSWSVWPPALASTTAVASWRVSVFQPCAHTTALSQLSGVPLSTGPSEHVTRLLETFQWLPNVLDSLRALPAPSQLSSLLTKHQSCCVSFPQTDLSPSCWDLCTLFCLPTVFFQLPFVPWQLKYHFREAFPGHS